MTTTPRGLGVAAAIPSPPDNAIALGPLPIRAFGAAIAVGAIVSVVIAQRRWAARGGDPADISRLAVWAVAAGVVDPRMRTDDAWVHEPARQAQPYQVRRPPRG